VNDNQRRQNMCKLTTLYLIENKETNKFSISRYINYEIISILKVNIRKAQRIIAEKDIIETDKYIIRTIYDIDMGNRGGYRDKKQSFDTFD